MCFNRDKICSFFRETGCDAATQARYFNIKVKPILEQSMHGLDTQPILNWMIVQAVHIVSLI